MNLEGARATSSPAQQVRISQDNLGGCAASNGTPLLEIRHLTKHFMVRRRLFASPIVVHAVDDINLHVSRGETLGLVGESGSGKTTVGRCVLRLVEPTSGEIWLKGENILKLSGKALRAMRQKMQMVFQDPADSLNPRFSCRQILLDAFKHAGVKRSDNRLEMAVHLLEQVGLSASDLEKYPHQFSGGQQQRIAIARALAFKPSLLVLDEPTASLDVSVKTQVTGLLRDLQDELSLSYILISHDLSNVRHVSHRVAVMYLGKVVEIGATAEMFAQPLHPYTKVLIESVPIPDPKLARKRPSLKGEIPSPISPPSGCRFHTRCPLKESICTQIEPQLTLLDSGRWVACHLITS